MSDKEIIEAAKNCAAGGLCEECKMCDEYNCAMIFADLITKNFAEKEPAPSANDTSSKENISCINDSTNKRICQELISQAQTNLLTIYDGMSEGECRAWELGELFKTLEFAKKAGEEK